MFFDPKFKNDLSGSSNREQLRRVLFFLACCHTIVIDEKKGTYNAASPDELALVNAAKQFGFEFKGIDNDDNMMILDKDSNEIHRYQLLNVCEFTSTRKRMSVILRDPQGRIVLMCKGADSVVMERLSQASLNGEVLSKTQTFVTQYAETGLRTLFLSERYIDQKEYDIWSAKSQEAKLAIKDREARVAEVDELIEVDMELIGSTAIEDRLQDEVADTI